MRELAKSMIRFSWAMSVFSLEQLGTLLGESKDGSESKTGDKDDRRDVRAADEQHEQRADEDTTGSGEKAEKETRSRGKQSDRQQRISASLDEVVSATGDHFSERSRNLFDSGDRLQGEMVDMFFDMFSADRWKAEAVLDRTADLIEETADALRRAAGTDRASGDEATEDAEDPDETGDPEHTRESRESQDRSSSPVDSTAE